VSDAAKAESNYFNFSEGICVNEWNLRPLKRDRPTGFTRFKEGITNLEIVPTNINYSSFSKNPKTVSFILTRVSNLKL
jgi:hypothetical protein